MRSPGVLATALLFRRLARELEKVNASLARLVDAQELRLKLEAMRMNLPLSELREAEETTEEDRQRAREGEHAPGILQQTDTHFAELERLNQTYFKAFGRMPNSEEDLIEILKKGGDQAEALRHAGKVEGE